MHIYAHQKELLEKLLAANPGLKIIRLYSLDDEPRRTTAVQLLSEIPKAQHYGSSAAKFIPNPPKK